LDAAKDVPRVSIARAIRLNTLVVIFFMTILLSLIFEFERPRWVWL
jgi:hypothetical protein